MLSITFQRSCTVSVSSTGEEPHLRNANRVETTENRTVDKRGRFSPHHTKSKMATGESKKVSETEVDESGDVSRQCPICLEKYRRPKLLPCFHSFCQSCLEGLVGTSLSFSCPSCRTPVVLPAGGVRALQTNFYIEDDQSSPPQRLCDMCADDRQATHSCIQCQQRYCPQCRTFHDSIPSCRGHSVVALTPGEEEGCGEEGPGREQMCPKHPDQRIVFHCTMCQADLCLHCKLTKHEGHPTQDLADIRSKVKDKLKDRLGSLTLAMQQIDHTVGVLEDRCSKLQQQKEETEEACHARAAMLHEWVNQSLEDALQTLHESVRQSSKPWKDHVEQLCSQKLAMQAKQDHILRVLRSGREADIVSLEAQLSSSSVDEVDVKELMNDLAPDGNCLQVEHNPDAVSQPQLRFFIGVLESTEQMSNRPSAKGTDVKDATHTVPSASRDLGVVRKKPPREFIYSKNPRSSVIHMRPISHGRLWVLYRHTDYGNFPSELKLFDAEGRVLTRVEYPHSCAGLLSVTDDVVLAWYYEDSSVQLISADGSLTTYDMGKKIDRFISCAGNDVHYVKEYGKEFLCGVKFACKDWTGSGESAVAKSLPQSQVTPTLSEQLTHSVLEEFMTPENMIPEHVSAGGSYRAYNWSYNVGVYSTAISQCGELICDYQTTKQATDVHFCQIDGEDMLLVTVAEDPMVHVVGLTDRGYLERYLDTGPLTLNRPGRLATDSDQHVWIGCQGGKVVMVDL